MTASASIDCWRGTYEELNEPVLAMLRGLGTVRSIHVTSTDLSGTAASRSVDMDQVAGELTSVSDSTLALRVSGTGVDGRTAALVARRVVPGLSLELTDSDAARALGNCQLVFQRMMIGYVDRMGGARGLLWMATAFAPLTLMSIAASSDQASSVVRFVVIAACLVASALSFWFSYARILYSDPLVITAELQHRDIRTRVHQFKTTIDRPRVRWVLGVLGTLALGALASRLSLFIP